MALSPRLGLCASCAHARRVVSQRKSEFLLCERGSRREPGFVRYPPLPVIECVGQDDPVDTPGRRGPRRPGS